MEIFFLTLMFLAPFVLIGWVEWLDRPKSGDDS